MTSTVAATSEICAASLEGDFRRDGFVLLPNALALGELEALRAEATAIVRGERGMVEGVVAASPEESDEDVLRRVACVHFPHKLSPVMTQAARTPKAISALTTLIGPNVKLMQSMLFIKSEGKAGQAWHQDENFIPTRDRSLCAVWIALDAATVENGCLWVIPGSHRLGVLYPDREHDDVRFDCTHESYGFAYDESDAVPIEVPAGAAVVFDGYLLHSSQPNSGGHGMRRALVNHYMSAESLLPWMPPDKDAWMGKADYRDILLVAGEDPYAFKGTTDISRPHIRQERMGGCSR